MRTLVVSAAIFASLAAAAAGEYRNVALRRAVYQSSAADYGRVGHLATDGIVDPPDTSSPTCTADPSAKSPVGETASCAFDGNVRTKWLVFTDKTWQVGS